ncbi:hypothetical protein SLEP1_g49840 [Rubroshorea leprosula]|uniref:Bifunctional inhibitor/plant lipid transfer protein/seed storage helical domain-containing protein n=1 Tax=Rubroshorea leprosula TaxID=152421 RepID=A0AAV5LZ11_9ROSI|nr:hypothetical protein SLEP1_g49840 [Rubroshorea leprosula]
MATRGLNIGLVMVLVTLFCARTMAQSGTSGCTTVIVSLAPCLNYVSGASSTPTSSCCSQLASVVKSQPACLCSLLNGSSLGVTINQTQALALPAACNVQTPPVSECNGNCSFSSIPKQKTFSLSCGCTSRFSSRIQNSTINWRELS